MEFQPHRVINVALGDAAAQMAVDVLQIFRLAAVNITRDVEVVVEFHVDSDLERVPLGWLQILPVYMKYSPVASESCAWSKSGPLDP